GIRDDLVTGVQTCALPIFRGSLKKAADRRLFDPVTAVVYVRTGEFFSEGHWTEAAAAIGLEYSGCAEIVAASNYEWDPSCRQGEIGRASCRERGEVGDVQG